MSLTKDMVMEEMKKGAVVINVLDKPAFDELHIKGSINIPRGKKQSDEFVAEVDRMVGRDKLIITHCTGITCVLGPQAAALLKSWGFKAEDYPGGIEEWSEAGMPVEGKKVTPHAA